MQSEMIIYTVATSAQKKKQTQKTKNNKETQKEKQT